MIAKAATRYSNLQETACQNCGKRFEVAPIYLKRGQYKYCGLDCRNMAQVGRKNNLSPEGSANIADFNIRTKKGVPISEEHRRKIGVGVRKITAEVHNEEWRRKVSAANKGRVRYICTPETRKKMSASQSRNNNNNWRGGVSSVNHLIRTSKEYKGWRKAVFERDNFTCQECGQRGGSLEVDHVKPFSLYPDLRLVISNGRTLCKPCHKLIGWNYFRDVKWKKEVPA